jgi:hypothetical protein
MQHNDTVGKFALLTRQELAYLSDGLPKQLTNAQESKLNYKIKKKMEIFEKVELPLLIRSGFELGSISLSIENDKDCPSIDPGSNLCPWALLSSLFVSSSIISLLLLRVCDFHQSVLNVEFGGSASQYGISPLESCS